MRLTTLVSVLALFAPPATTLTSAGCMCTLVGYENGVQIDIDVPPRTPASYQVEMEAAGDVLSLQYEVTADAGIRCVGECEATGDHVVVHESIRSHDEDLIVNVRTVDNEGGPKRVTVRLSRDGALLSEDTFEPRYETSEPNGRGCGEHVFANVTVGVL